MASTNTSSRRTERGHTLVELLMSLTIGTIIMVGLMTGYFMTSRQFRAISNYWEIHTAGRYAIDRFGADIRQVSSVTAFATNGPVTVIIPLAFSSTGAVISNKTVTYTFSNNSLKRTDSASGVTTILADNVYQLTFRMFDRVGAATSVISNSKSLQVELYFRKFTANQKQTEDYLSARLDMRNKP